MGNDTFRLKIYGVRGSHPPTTGKATQYGVNTACLRIDIGRHLLIVDAGTGIIDLGKDLLSEIKSGKSKQNLFKLHLFFTHTHIDHLFGFPYFNMLYLPKTEMHIISPPILNITAEEVLNTWMSPAFFPVAASELPGTLYYHDFGENRQVYFFENDFKVLPVTEALTVKGWIGRISCLRNYTHPKGGNYIYKFENSRERSIVFATDVEGMLGGDQRLIDFAKNTDVLIHDAQYSPEEYLLSQGFGHSTYEMACEVAQKASVKKLILFHHDPNHSDEELQDLENQAKKIFPHSYIADETMEFSF